MSHETKINLNSTRDKLTLHTGDVVEFTSLTTEEIATLFPNLHLAIKFAQDHIKNMIGKSPVPQIQPAIVFCTDNSLRRWVTDATSKSQYEHNEKRSYGHFSPDDYTIFLDSKESNAADQDSKNRVVLEELIHAFTTRYDNKNEKTHCGFMKLPHVPTREHRETGFYSMQKVSDGTPPDKSEPRSYFVEDVESLNLTENLTHILVEIELNPDKNLVIVNISGDDIVPLLLPLPIKKLQEIFKKSCGMTLSQFIFNNLAEGDVRRLNQNLDKALKKMSDRSICNPEIIPFLRSAFRAETLKRNGIEVATF